MIAKWLILCAVGKLLMYLWCISPYAEWLKKYTFFEKLFRCHLCLGVWVYTSLLWGFGVNVLDQYIPFISEIITGGTTSFLVWLMSEGWNAHFRTYELRV